MPFLLCVAELRHVQVYPAGCDCACLAMAHVANSVSKRMTFGIESTLVYNVLVKVRIMLKCFKFIAKFIPIVDEIFNV